jgi:hypothetical protein
MSSVKQDLNYYRAENGQILKMKMMLTDIKVDDTKSSLIGLKYFSVTITENDIDTSRLEYSTPEQITDKDIVSELGFSTLKETVNIYETQKALLFVTPRVLKVFLTNKKDVANSPLLRFTHRTSLNIRDKESLYEQKDKTVTSKRKSG